MKINNKYFGEIEYEAEEKLSFPDGLFGFEEHKEFLPIPFEEGTDTLICLQSLADQDLSFILLNPFAFFVDYDPQISKEDQTAIGSPKEEDISYYVIGVIRDRVADSTVNLKAPIAVNSKTRNARQIILEDPAYTFRHALGETKGREE
ncbi:MAG: flagellar assembly protein FliW [Lachnospiraceae bacterium]|jgi:flagellar assembly factor FliW|uniref:flagellar assembly protein FliW n=1 Tax=Candidatus Merdisoma sp. JLR.KK006 TaxID=3112626 RepID=UPI002FF060FF|nr:flagellar assembly protein FliW [Lachnospiraceae bacterium]